MGDVLSQAEIDALLSALSDGQVDVEEIQVTKSQKRIRVYDFKRPNKFSKDQIHSLQNIHENFCRGLTTYFSGNLHSVVESSVLSIEQITYDEFIRSLPNPTVLGLYSLNPLEGTVLIEVNPSLTFAVVDRLLGGQGKGMEKNRDLTEIEKTIIENRLNHMIAISEEAWAEVYELKPQFVAMETNPQFTQIVAPNEMVVLITLEVRIGEAVGMINLCMPYLVLEPILDKLSTFFLFSTKAKVTSPEQVQAIRKKIEWAKVDMIAFLGHSEILVRDLLDLTEGDVIPLNQSVNDPLPIFVGEFMKFKSIPGLHGEHLAVQISEIIEEGGDHDG
ncbi:flagellar motor switch protein FliM [Desulfosporosinus sp. BICA1-9]|uniref:flagellar motor switch protein FliM n=1 Tax=Desulfosporosinus sp. BICA1-9 TaxID=1531958 RepID=UPI00054C38E0|nr:flagellar motor switch protein FliM [Desulfosporosinus sp. BICA1-9]KJS47207.1 MAG: flagellar motor switch protein FliM [Peptococcaceae bacterium BRH_c23]KJS90022.1 MAG: flagellar motor switch protein FliM [Desulfosporosinus sp. BICA1-9]